MTHSLATSPSMAFSPYLNHMGPGMGLMPELLPSTPLLVPGSPTGLAAMSNGTSSHKHMRTDKLEVCSLIAAVPCIGTMKRQILTSELDRFARFVGNSSAVTARGARATVATLIRWRPAWWTAARTQSSSAWTTLKDAAAETSASTSIRRHTCKPGSRPHSTKPVKTQRLQLWWVIRN